MNKRKLAAGTGCTVLSAILAVVGFVFYMINANTAYFSSIGKSGVVIGTVIAAVVCDVCYLVSTKRSNPAWSDVLPIVSIVCLWVATLQFIASRIAGVASIMTFENNEQNMADLKSAIIGVVVLLVAAIVMMVGNFFDTRKDA
ncbi:MAG: hypothetical protein K6A05_00660 [Lachnospiraceae bacterium]|nr:hypothetical protein [Lachnospiraceae bacterium]